MRMRLGVDFGTTHTVVALVDRGNYPVVSFEGGDFVPSLVAAHDASGTLRWGWDAAEVRHEPGWTVLPSIKRLLSDAGPSTEVAVGPRRLPIAALLEGFFSALHRELVARSNAGLAANDSIAAAVSVPANASTAQRFLTIEAFKGGGFAVEALLNEPSAAGFEYAHRNRRDGRREHLVVYDLGGGTFDASLLRMTGKTNEVVATHGVQRLGGDDFDEAILGLVLGKAGARDADVAVRDLVLEECVRAKEALSASSRRFLVDLSALGKEPLVLPVEEVFEVCAPLVARTLESVAALVEDGAGASWADVASLYVVGGAGLLPLIPRLLRERFGDKRVRRSPHPFAATAIGLAVWLDREGGYALEDRLSRHFGVFREAGAGREVVFDTIFEKGTPLPAPGSPPVTVTRRYRAAHDVGHFRFLECSRLTDGRPDGDVTPWDEAFFPFEAGLRAADLGAAPVRRREGGPEAVEIYALGSEGAVTVTVTDATDGFSRTFRLTR
jgi:molecular chaperone DnaK